MKIYCPEIAWHNQEPVLSLDIRKIDTNCYKVVTSGSDRHLVVWRVVLGQNNQQSQQQPQESNVISKKQVSIEPLADLNRHQKAINVVKFSASATMFASGDDEGNIFIWKLQDKENVSMVVDSDNKSKRMSTGSCFDGESDGIVNEEDWIQWKSLRGHNEDVVDLCWSPNGQFLLSGSVDNEAIVWDVNKGVKLNCLGGHKGYVQGVAWDPFDNYITTLSTDRSLRVFNSMTKRLVYKVYKGPVKVEDKVKNTRLFYDDTLPTYSRRICFSPGGELLFAPSGVVELDPDEENFKFTNAVHIFSRTCINKPICYISTGTLYNTAVRCCPQLFELREDLDNPYPFPYRIVFAIATQESVLLCDTQQSLPFAMISNIHYTRLTDISWSDDGRLLLVSSTDGYCTFIIFNESELGTPYHGPYYSHEPAQTNSTTSPTKDSCKAETQAPDSASKSAKKNPEIVKITNFFPKVDKSEVIQSIETPPPGSAKSLKRKETPILTIESPMKKFHSEAPSVEIKNETNRLNGEEKPLKTSIAQKLSTSFDRIAIEDKMVPEPELNGILETMKKIKEPKIVPPNGCHQQTTPQGQKVPRRVSFITLTAPKRD